jgi:tripartite-type tricarboxylate transporter receptor subunit TctC
MNQHFTGGLRRRHLIAASLAAPWIAPARAQADYPNKPIRLINSSPPGSTFDTVARAASVEAEKRLGQSVVMEYRSGAGGTPAFVQVKNSPPDGYTLVILSLSTVRQPLLENVGYEGVKDFTWIASLAEINFGVLVPADSPFRTWQDLLAFGRANPQKVSYGCPSGLGNSAHIFTAEVAAREKVDWTAVPFRASNDTMAALLGGQLTFSVDTTISGTPQVQAGKARWLAMATDTRLKAFPHVPSMRELGYGVKIESPIGIGGPAGMPAPVVQKLQDAFCSMRAPGWRPLTAVASSSSAPWPG